MALTNEAVSKIERSPYCADQVLMRGGVATDSSTTTPLAADATFTGKPIDLLDWAGAIITAHPDTRSATDGLVVEFSVEGTSWHESDLFTVKANALKTYTFQPVMRYMRLRYTNGPVAQSHFHLQVQLRTVAVKSSSHRLVDAIAGQDDAEVVKAIIEDRHGHAGEFNFTRDLRTAHPHRVVGSAFHGATLDTNWWTPDTSGAGAAVVQADHDVKLSSGTANDGYAHLGTKQNARFVFAHPMHYRSAIRISEIEVAENLRRWGAYTVTAGVPQNGFYFELDDANGLELVHASGGTPTHIVAADWNGDLTGFDMDTSLHAYEIHYFVMRAEYYIDEILVHTLVPAAVNLVGSFDLAAAATTVNSASGTTSADIDVHAALILRVGKSSTDPICSVFPSGQTAGVVAKYGPGAIHKLILSGVINNAQVVIYDNTAASGAILFDSGTMATKTDPFTIDFGVLPFYTGLAYKVITANAAITLVYE